MSRTQNNYLFYLICAGLALATFIAFEPVRHNGFLDFDDGMYVTDEPHVSGGISFGSVLWAFTKPHVALWHPLTSLSHMLDCQLFGLKPGRHHLTSLLFHIVNTLLLFWVLREMTGGLWQSGFVAAAFALHPLHVESVAWIAERKDVLSGFFWILTMGAYLRYVKRSSIKWYMLTLLSFVLGLMAKPMVVTLPFVLLLLDYWPLGRFEFGQRSYESARIHSQRQALYRLVWEKIPFFILSGLFSIIAFWAQRGIGAVMRSLPLKLRIANALVSYVSYIGKMIYPSRLACLYPHPGDSLPAWEAVASFVLLAGITAGVVYAGRWRYLAVGWLWYMGTLVPVIGLIQIGSQAMADRYTYLLLIGIFIMVSWGSAELFSRWRYGKVVPGILAGVVLTAMLIGTRVQVRYWRDGVSLFGHAVEVTTSNYLAHNNLGSAFLSRGKLDEAISHFRQSLQIKADYTDALNNLGFALQSQGRFDEAIGYFHQALQVEPNNAETYNNLGSALVRRGKLDEAINCFRRVLEIKPDYAEAHYNLGLVLKSQGKLDGAINEYYQALQINPEFALAHHKLGVALKFKGKLDEAISHFRQALKFSHDDAEIHNDLGIVLQLQGRLDEALGCYREAIRLKSGWPLPLSSAAWILAAHPDPNRRDPSEAIRLAKQAVRLTKSQDVMALDTLAVAYSAGGRFEQAVITAQAALDLASAAKNEKLVDHLRGDLELYKRGKP